MLDGGPGLDQTHAIAPVTCQDPNPDTVDPATSRVSSARLGARRRRVQPRQINLVGIASANYWQRIDWNTF
jgi:hypothetical protein